MMGSYYALRLAGNDPAIRVWFWIRCREIRKDVLQAAVRMIGD